MPDSSTTAMTESAAANPKAGAAPTQPANTPPNAGPLAKAIVRASAICSGDCAARLGHARRLKVGGRLAAWSVGGMTDSLQFRSAGIVWPEKDGQTTRFPTTQFRELG